MWRSRYHRLHLHDILDECNLPNLKMPETFPTYVTRHQYASYLDAYALAMSIDVRTKHKAIHIYQDKTSNDWVIEAEDISGDEPFRVQFRAKHVVIANGIYNDPFIPSITGLDKFQGKVVHSSAYTNATDEDLVGKNVLVVGFGNSGAEIVIDLVVGSFNIKPSKLIINSHRFSKEHGANPVLLQRSPICIVPRGVIQQIQAARYRYEYLKWVPLSYLCLPVVAVVLDIAMKVLARVKMGWIERYGVRICWATPVLRMLLTFDPPLMDVGTIDCIKSGKAVVKYGSIASLSDDHACFSDGTKQQFDAIVFATGYEFLSGHKALLDADAMEQLGFGANAIRSRKILPGKESIPGLWFIWGRLQMIRDAAQPMSASIAARLGHKVPFWTPVRRYIAYQTVSSLAMVGLVYYYFANKN
jgi:indole-3-pyruvate monooxygenase